MPETRRVCPTNSRPRATLLRCLLYTLFAPDGISPGGDCVSSPPYIVRLSLGVYPRKVAFATGHDAVSIGPRARKS